MDEICIIKDFACGLTLHLFLCYFQIWTTQVFSYVPGLLVKPSISWSISSLKTVGLLRSGGGIIANIPCLGIYEELVLDFSGRRCFIGCIQQNVGCSHDL